MVGIGEGTNDLDDEVDGHDFDDDDDESDDNTDPQKNLSGSSAGVSERHTKKRKLKSLILSYEFAPHVSLPHAEELAAAAPSSAPKSSLSGWNAKGWDALTD